jgi:hypothetical protein
MSDTPGSTPLDPSPTPTPAAPLPVVESVETLKARYPIGIEISVNGSPAYLVAYEEPIGGVVGVGGGAAQLGFWFSHVNPAADLAGAMAGKFYLARGNFK